MQHPVVIIGAGPIGLAAAANAAERGIDFVVLEAGPQAGRGVDAWSHVRLFSSVVRARRSGRAPAPRCAGGWRAPDNAHTRPVVSGAEPTCSRSPTSWPTPRTVRYDSRVTGVGRAGRDLLVDSGRESRPVRRPPADASRTRTAASERRRRRLRHLDPAEPARRRRLPRPRRSRGTRTASATASPTSATRRPCPVRGQARGRGRQGRLGPERADRAGRSGRGATRPPASRGWSVAPAVGQAFGGGDNDQLDERGSPGRQGQAGRRRRDRAHVTALPHGRHRPAGRRPAHPEGSRRSAGHRRRRGHRRHRVPPGLEFLSRVRLDLDPLCRLPRCSRR